MINVKRPFVSLRCVFLLIFFAERIRFKEFPLATFQGVIEGISDLVTGDRQFLSFDLVSMPHGQGGRKERGFFLFNDLLVITSIKRRSGTIKKPST